MPLHLSSRFQGNVYVIQCSGFIVLGDEVNALEAALERGAREFSRFVLNLAEVDRLDSIALGLLVRFATRVQKRGGDLRLAAPKPFVVKLLTITTLDKIIHAYPTEEEAVASFTKHGPNQRPTHKPQTSVLVFDQSADLCLFVKTVLSGHGFDVRSTNSLRDARILLGVDKVDYILVGPGTPQLSPETVRTSLLSWAPWSSAPTSNPWTPMKPPKPSSTCSS
jgi:anti-anti-sigma factor